MTWPFVSRRAYDLAIEERDRLRNELTIAQDRLLAAWNDGKIIPARPAEKLPPPPPLDPVLVEYISQFESEEGRQTAEEAVRSMEAHGMKPLAILKHFENQHP